MLGWMEKPKKKTGPNIAKISAILDQITSLGKSRLLLLEELGKESTNLRSLYQQLNLSSSVITLLSIHRRVLSTLPQILYLLGEITILDSKEYLLNASLTEFLIKELTVP